LAKNQIAKRHLTDPSEWIIVENTHEPLVDMETWETVQKRLALIKKEKSKVCNTGELSLFANILRCADCGSKMAFNGSPQQEIIINYKFIGNMKKMHPQKARIKCGLFAVQTPKKST